MAKCCCGSLVQPVTEAAFALCRCNCSIIFVVNTTSCRCDIGWEEGTASLHATRVAATHHFKLKAQIEDFNPSLQEALAKHQLRERHQHDCTKFHPNFKPTLTSQLIADPGASSQTAVGLFSVATALGRASHFLLTFSSKMTTGSMRQNSYC